MSRSFWLSMKTGLEFQFVLDHFLLSKVLDEQQQTFLLPPQDCNREFSSL